MKEQHRPVPPRLVFIDVARSLGIVLALLAHALSTYGVSRSYPAIYPITQLVTIAATPMFIFMFGFMLEFVYAPRVQRDGLRRVARRLYVRSFQCYLAYGLITLSALLGGALDAEGFIEALVFADDSKYGNVLRVYVVALLLFVPLLSLRIKFGRFLWLFLLIVIYGSFGWLETLESRSFAPFDHTMNMLFGVGPVVRGPSVWHALAFVFAGAFVSANVRLSVNYRPAFLKGCAAVVVLLVTLVVLFHHDPPAELVRKWISGHYRAHNMFEYYALGTVYCVAILAFLTVVPEHLMSWIGRRSSFMALGQSSLLSFMLGNIILNLTAPYAEPQVPPLLALVGFFAVLAFAIHQHRSIPGYSFMRRGLFLGGG